MTPDEIALDPTFPLCWENTETLRIGFDQAEVRLHAPSPAAQRFMDKLRSGLHPREFAGVASRAGLTAEEQVTLMRELAPVLINSGAPTPHTQRTITTTASFAVLGEGEFARGIRKRFEQSGLLIVQGGEAPDFAILVEQFLGASSRAQPLLSNNIPHLQICATDRRILLGPLVLAGGMPCLACVELHNLDREPLLHVLAAQLAGDIPPAATAHGIELISTIAIAVARRWQHGEADLVGARLSFPVHKGLPAPTPDREQLTPHPACGCVSLSQLK